MCCTRQETKYQSISTLNSPPQSNLRRARRYPHSLTACASCTMHNVTELLCNIMEALQNRCRALRNIMKCYGSVTEPLWNIVGRYGCVTEALWSVTDHYGTVTKCYGTLQSHCGTSWKRNGSSMLHGSETWPVRKKNEVALQRTEMRMVKWMCGVKLQDRVPSKELRGRLGLDDIISE